MLNVLCIPRFLYFDWSKRMIKSLFLSVPAYKCNVLLSETFILRNSFVFPSGGMGKRCLILSSVKKKGQKFHISHQKHSGKTLIWLISGTTCRLMPLSIQEISWVCQNSKIQAASTIYCCTLIDVSWPTTLSKSNEESLYWQLVKYDRSQVLSNFLYELVQPF